MYRLFFVLLATVLSVGFSSSAHTQINVDTSCADTANDLIRVIDSTSIQIGNVMLDRARNEIVLPGWINMNQSVVEYLAVAQGGKTHESVLLLDVKPLHVQIALLLLGLDYGQNLAFQGDTVMPEGDRVMLSVTWADSSSDTVTLPAADLLINLHDSTTVPATDWVFTGSMIWENQLLADVEGSLVATYSDPAAILNIPLSGRSDDTVYGANKKVLPEPGTPVKMIIVIPEKTSNSGDSR